jgi:hypothetical protein
MKMYLQKVIIRIFFCFNKLFVGVLKVNDENSRIRIKIRIHYSQKHGSGTLVKTQ